MPEIKTHEQMARTLPMRSKIGQLFMPAAFIHDTEEEIRSLEYTIREHHVGGLCFFHSRASAATNFEGAREIPYHSDSLLRLQYLIRRYQDAARYPLLIAMDAEWGLAMRVERAPQYPYALTLGALKKSSDELLYELGLRMARDCREAGIHWNLCPVVDINTNPDNPVISYRAFGSRPEAVTRKALALYRGLRDGGILTCLKHFPGHGDTAVDSHLSLPVLQKDLPELESQELLPFRALTQAGAPAVMPGHLSLPRVDPSGLPASLSPRIIGMLRERLGFEGVVLTDALNMHALHGIEARPERLNAMALEAGNDILCFAQAIPASIEAILERIAPSRLEESFRRVWKLKERMFLHPPQPVEPGFAPEVLNRELAGGCLCEIGPVGDALERFRSKGFSLLYAGERPGLFIDLVRVSQKVEEGRWEPGNTDALDTASRQANVLLALSPPAMKPAGNFGLPAAFFEGLSDLCRQAHVLLYLFGNPYLLTKLPPDAFRGILCAFQPLEAFQRAAADHFLGNLRAEGELPIDLSHE